MPKVETSPTSPKNSPANQSDSRAPKNRGKRCIYFEVKAPSSSSVFVAGDFNDWRETTHRMSDHNHRGVFRREIYVDPGRFEYKFLIDNEWHIDTNCTSWSPNEFGSLNSVVEV